MKIILKYIMPFMALLLITSCGDEELVDYSEGGVQDIADAFLQINSPVVSFQANTPSYELDLNLVNGTKHVNKLNIYSVFTDAGTGAKSNEVLFKSISIANGESRSSIVENISYSDLKADLKVNGSDLPSDEQNLAVGSGWVLSFKGETDNGTVPLLGKINVAVLSRFAGIYRVVESDYYRINVQSSLADWSGQTRFIGSIDETTFSYNDFWGPFAWGGSSFNFSIDFGTNAITVPILTDSGLFSGNRALSCITEPGLFVDVPCAGSDVFIEDISGEDKHRIILTYGYFSDGSGSRQFYEVLEKVN